MSLSAPGGTNRYGEPLFKLVWSSEPRTIVGGRFADGFVGYRSMPSSTGASCCWALMIWEGPEAYGDPLAWEYQYRQADTGCLDCGSFPKEGRYRLLKQFMHRELVQQEVWKIQYNWKRRKPERVLVQRPQLVTTKMEPCGLSSRSDGSDATGLAAADLRTEARGRRRPQEAPGCRTGSRDEGCHARFSRAPREPTCTRSAPRSD